MRYIPPAYRVDDDQTLRAFMRTYDFALVISPGAGDVAVTHLPVLLREDGDGLVIAGHMAKANDHWQLMDGQTAAVVVFHGPHGYVSPSYYETTPAVPTWNYSAVHAHGKPIATHEEPFLRGAIEELVNRYEEGRAEPWSPYSLPGNGYDTLLQHVVGFEMRVDVLEGKFKLDQTHPPADRAGTVAALEASGDHAAALLAAFMREHAP